MKNMVHRYLLEGYIPIVDIKSIPTSINGYNTSKSNYWELFFEQPFGYNLDNVLKYAKNIITIQVYNFGIILHVNLCQLREK